jgi:hypothetical protein
MKFFLSILLKLQGKRCETFRSVALAVFCCFLTIAVAKDSYPVVVVGGSASGVCAALQSARLGTKTLLVEPTPWLGGMLTSAGVSAVDGCYRLRSGIWGELLDSLVAHYGNLENLRTGWVSNVMFEPSVGNAIFSRMCRAESNLTVLNGSSLTINNQKWEKGLETENLK